ncbi:hypothetical protein [Streptomyces sp. KL116D]|uniref:hypothetical protein n=1 Tax=Streptomyces sp. KL116D TaxID=3045152 RepID=UPI0035567533
MSNGTEQSTPQPSPQPGTPPSGNPIIDTPATVELCAKDYAGGAFERVTSENRDAATTMRHRG